MAKTRCHVVRMMAVLGQYISTGFDSTEEEVEDVCLVEQDWMNPICGYE